MIANTQILDALDIDCLQLPPSLRVVGLEADDYTDSGGEPALRVQVILDEAIDIDAIQGSQVGDLKFAIRKSLQKHGITLFPYVFLAKRSELAESAGER